MSQKVHFAIINHQHGQNVYAATTRDILIRDVAQYCREWWGEWADQQHRPPPENTEQLIKEYFEDASDAEWCDIDTTVVVDN